MKLTDIDPNMTVDEFMRREPATIRVFIRNRMLCIGCPTGIFHTVKDACEAHQIDEGAFLRELLVAMKDDDTADAPSSTAPASRAWPLQGGPSAAGCPNSGGSTTNGAS